MSAVSYQDLALSWHPKKVHDNSFILFFLVIATLFSGAGFLLSYIDVPQKEHRTKAEIPERIAKFILDKPKPVPKPQEAKVVEKPKPKTEPKPKPKPKVKRERPKKEIQLTKKQHVARQKAEQSGLLALSEELSDLMDTSSIDMMLGKTVQKRETATQAPSVNTDLLLAGAGAMSGGRGAQIGADLPQLGTATKLDAQQRAVAQQLISARVGETLGQAEEKGDDQPRVGNYRSEEEIAYVIDKNKSKLHAIYRKARRSDPGIKGKIVLEITILPSGKVAGVKIRSSELNNARLEARIVARIKQFDFGAQNVKEVTVTYPIEFLPS